MLVDDGLVEKRRSLGMYVHEGAREKLLENERALFLKQELPSFLERAMRLGYPRELLVETLSKEGQ